MPPSPAFHIVDLHHASTALTLQWRSAPGTTVDAATLARIGQQVDSHVEQRVAAASIEQIKTWTRRVLSVVTLGEPFAN